MCAASRALCLWNLSSGTCQHSEAPSPLVTGDISGTGFLLFVKAVSVDIGERSTIVMPLFSVDEGGFLLVFTETEDDLSEMPC